MAAPLAAGAALGAAARLRKPVLIGGALIALFAYVAVGTLTTVLLGSGQQPTGYAPSGLAVADIPGEYLELYLKAGREYDIDWSVLAAIGKIETNHGRAQLPGVRSGVNAYGCCAGPMQFFISPYPGRIPARETNPSTWGAFAVDGDRDGWKNVYDPADAIPTAAKYLVAGGAPGDYQAAIFSYNHAAWYVADVLAQAELYRGALKASRLGESAGTASAAEVLANPRIQLTPGQRADLASGGIDARLIDVMAWIGKRHSFLVTAFRRDHSPGTNHEAGRAIDIGIVDGKVCNPYGPADACGRLVTALAALKGAHRPTELIASFDPDGPGDPRSWEQADHHDHIHLGYDG